MTVIAPPIRIKVSGARGPRGAASGPLADNSVGAVEIKDSSVEQAAIRDKLDLLSATEQASSSGAGHIGFSHTATYPDDTVGRKLQQTINPLDAPYSATGDGVANDRAALLAADADGPVHLTPGLYYVGSNLTLNNPLVIEPGARLVIPNGVTVTCNGGIEAGEYQIVNLVGTGNLAGLVTAKQAWFDGDIATLPGLPVSGTTCDIALQKAFRSLASGGVLHGDARNRAKGSSQIDPGPASFDGHGVAFLWNSAVTMGFNLTACDPSTIFTGFSFAPLVPGTIPTSGIAVLMGRSNFVLSDFTITDAYTAIDDQAGVSCHIYDGFIYGSRIFGIRVSTIDQYLSDLTIQALNDWITLSGVTGTFNVGDSITVNGTVGHITAKYSATSYRIFFNVSNGVQKGPPIGVEEGPPFQII